MMHKKCKVFPEASYTALLKPSNEAKFFAAYI